LIDVNTIGNALKLSGLSPQTHNEDGGVRRLQRAELPLIALVQPQQNILNQEKHAQQRVFPTFVLDQLTIHTISGARI
jgi:hypothetical protein